MIDEPEILDGTRAWPETQRLFVHVADTTRPRHQVDTTWYDTAFDEHEGAFCFVNQGSDLEELVGDFVLVTFRAVTVYLYCVGAGPLPTDLALALRAFRELAPLWRESINTQIQAAADG